MTVAVGDEIKIFGRRAIVTRLAGGRMFFRYLVKGRLSSVERNMSDPNLTDESAS